MSLPITTAKQAIQSNTRSIVTIKKEIGQNGEVVVKALLTKIFKSVIEFFNVGKSVTDAQLAEIVGFVSQDFYFLKMADLKVWSDGIKKGKYLSFSNGKLFDRLDGQILIMSIHEYCEERISTAETIQMEKQGEVLAIEADTEKYIIQVNNKWLRDLGEELEEVEEKEMATPFGFIEACRIKKGIISIKGFTGKVSICDKNKASKSFFKYLEENAPHLLPKEKPNFKDSVHQYEVAKARIMNDENLSDLEKVNKLRAMAGLGSLTEGEYNLRLEKGIK